jgi:protein-glutamine gamma-glutamyltransferase
MDAANVKMLRSVMTIHFAMIAALTAMLVSYGSGSVFLPLFIMTICIVAFVLVDSLELFALNRLGVFLAMTAGTVFAVGTYLYNTFSEPSESGQLQAIAGLLVYPEAVLFMQRKNLRVFEQLAIFLLLEIMVAALVNDNVLFGILLLPIVLLWVSSLFHFSRYATLVQIAPNIEVPMPKLAEVLFSRFVKSIMGNERPPAIVESKLVTSADKYATTKLRRVFQSIPLGIGAIAFSALFFYCLPRTTAGGYRPKLNQQVQVGLPDTMTLGQVGRALQDPTPVMRVKITDDTTADSYTTLEGPYIRARVYDSFRRLGATTQWSLSPLKASFTYQPIPLHGRLSTDATKNRDRVRVEFDVLPSCNTDTFALMPTFVALGGRPPVAKINPYTQLLYADPKDTEEKNVPSYTIGSTEFENGRQLDIAPMLSVHDSVGLSQFLLPNLGNLLDIKLDDFPSVESLRTRILREAGVSEGENLGVAKAIEKYFSQAGEYKYTLDLTANADPRLDPIEDFIANHRAGHCQFFAATMLVMLRQSAIPCRLVVGYKPREFNSYGNYFHVRQRDAHAWLEARFSTRELVGTDYEKWTVPNSEYWIRFDPTPGTSDEDVIEQPNQFSDYADKLWKGYVLDARELTGGDGVDPLAVDSRKNIYAQIAQGWAQLKEDLTSGKFGTEGGSIQFSWQLAVVVTTVGIGIVLLWQLIVNLPRIAPRLANKIGMRTRRSDFNQEFFSRCVRALRKFGFEREDSQTPQELTREAADYLVREKGVASSNDWLHVLTKHYYLLRFGGGQTLNDQDQAEVQTAIKNLEKFATSRSSGEAQKT